MKEIIVKSLGFIFIIIIGYLFKRKGLFVEKDGLLLSKIIMRITLPAALIAGANNMTVNYLAIIIILIGLFSNILNIYISKFINRKSSPEEKAIGMINSSGYNIGNFAIPFAVSFFNETALMYMCMFDIGNGFMALGGTYVLAKNEVNENGKSDIKTFIKVLFSSIPFDVYILIFTLSLFKIKMPSEITTVASLIGSANSFLAMLMIGILLEINISKNQIKSTIKILSIRYICSIVLGLVTYFIIPIPILSKKMIIISLCAPLSTISTVYSKYIDPDNPIPALSNSISMIISIITTTILLLILV